jgi:hypothetical protein
VETNTTKLLLEGWRGLWVEAASTYVAEIRKIFAHKLADGSLKVRESVVTVANINDLIAEAGVGREIDLLSVDIERVLRAQRSGWRPFPSAGDRRRAL